MHSVREVALVNPQPCFPITGPRVRDGLHERDTSGIVVKTGWGAGLMVRRRYFGAFNMSGLELTFDDAWWVWCETAHRWRLCEPAGMFTAHAGDVP